MTSRSAARIAASRRDPPTIGQVPAGPVVQQLGLDDVDVAAVGGDVPRRAGLVVLADEPPFHVGPVADAGVAAGPFAEVAHVVDDERVGDAGVGE